MKFMLMMNAPRGDGDWGVKNWKVEELKAHIGFMKTFAQQLKSEGALVGAEGLAPPGQARVVRASKTDQSPEVTDGPFAEAKEFLAGYWIVDVESPEQAYAIAARASVAPGPGGKPLYLPIEVREVMSAPPVEP
ncbi:MAG TPA: YciI family protein [Polyangiaceae bacterium]|nr:YciI family protein [Polyangiaceae bacterium]